MSKSQDRHPTLFEFGLRLVLGGSFRLLVDFLDEECACWWWVSMFDFVDRILLSGTSDGSTT